MSDGFIDGRFGREVRRERLWARRSRPSRRTAGPAPWVAIMLRTVFEQNDEWCEWSPGYRWPSQAPSHWDCPFRLMNTLGGVNFTRWTTRGYGRRQSRT